MTDPSSVAALFAQCIESLSPSQLSPRFGRSAPRDLATARARLGRWGDAVGIFSDPRFTSPDPSRALSPAAATPGSVVTHLGDLDQARRLLEDMAELVDEAPGIEELLRDVAATLDGLERLVPMPMPRVGKRPLLVEMEVEEMEGDGEHVRGGEVGNAAGNGVAAAAAGVEGGNTASSVTAESGSRFMAGNVWGEGVCSRAFLPRDQTVNSVDTIIGRSQAKIQVGNVYGSRSLWDD